MLIYGVLLKAGIHNMLINKEIQYVIIYYETLLSWLCSACFPEIYMINPAREPLKYALTERVEG